jgi:uncharacterized protein (TIGR02284 family)
MDSSRQQPCKEEYLVAALREDFEALCVSQSALLEIAGKISDESIARLLYELAQARGKLALELQPFVDAGPSPKRDEGLLGQLKSLSRRIRAALSENDSDVVLSDLEELEALQLRHVRGIVMASQGHQVQRVLQRELEHMKKSHDSVQHLRNVKRWPNRMSQFFQVERSRTNDPTSHSNALILYEEIKDELGSDSGKMETGHRSNQGKMG